MTIIAFDGFECGDCYSVWRLVVGAPAADPVTYKNGAYSMRVGRNGQNVDTVTVDALTTGFGTPTFVSVRKWFCVNTLPKAGQVEQIAIIIGQGIGGYIESVVDENGHLYVYGNTTDYFQATVGRWELLELTATVAAARQLPGVLYINKTKVGSYTAVPESDCTKITSVTVGNAVAVSAKFNYDAHYDDVVVATGERLGDDYTIQTLVPTGDLAAEDGWGCSSGTDAFAMTNDIPFSIGDWITAGNQASFPGDYYQLCTFAAFTAVTNGIVRAVHAAAYGVRGTAGTGTTDARFRIRDNGNSQERTTDNSGGTLWVDTVKEWTSITRATDLSSAAWTKAAADAIAVGGHRGPAANCHGVNIYDMYKSILWENPHKDWAGIV